MPSLRWEPHAITSRGPMPPTDGGAGSAPTEVPPASVASVACPPQAVARRMTSRRLSAVAWPWIVGENGNSGTTGAGHV
jgi:hypothetical protein